MKIGVSLSRDLVTFAAAEAKRRGTTRSALLAQLLEAERIREQARRYLDRHGWDLSDDEEHDFVERLGALPEPAVSSISDGLRLALGL